MSYCVNCGVELGKAEQVCPLCGTPVNNPGAPVNPDAQTLFPKFMATPTQHISRKSLVGLLSLLFLIPVLLCVVCDMSLSRGISWSGYVIASCMLIYVFTVFPLVFTRLHRRTAPILCVLCDGAAVLLFLRYLQVRTHGDWFIRFAMPITCAVYALVILVQVIAIFAKPSGLVLVSICFYCIGAFCVFTEVLLNVAFSLRSSLIWSLYPLITFVLLGAILTLIDHNEPLKEKLEKKFFI